MICKSHLQGYAVDLMLVCLLLLCVAPGANAQQEEATHAYTQAGHLEITAKEPTPRARVISLKLNGQLLEELETDVGSNGLDVLATYTGKDATYVVLRSNMGQGACVGTDVYVLTVYNQDVANKTGRHVEVSSKLARCMGEIPGVSFDVDDHGNQIIVVAGSDLLT
jgi:hypothetical protein